MHGTKDQRRGKGRGSVCVGSGRALGVQEGLKLLKICQRITFWMKSSGGARGEKEVNGERGK